MTKADGSHHVVPFDADRREHLARAIRAQAVAEFGLGVRVDEVLELRPVAPVVARWGRTRASIEPIINERTPR